MDDQSPEGRAAIFDLLTDMQATFTKLEAMRIQICDAALVRQRRTGGHIPPTPSTANEH